MEEISNRLKKALNMRNMKAIELSEKTGIDKGSISSYCSGRYTPKSKNVYKMANALNIDPAWLLGYDVPCQQNNTTAYYYANNNIFKLTTSMRTQTYFYLGLNFYYVPNSTYEFKFKLKTYEPDIILYGYLIDKQIIKNNNLLNDSAVRDINKYIENNITEIKDLLKKYEDEHLNEWKKFKETPDYKKYILENENNSFCAKESGLLSRISFLDSVTEQDILKLKEKIANSSDFNDVEKKELINILSIFTNKRT